MSDTSCQYKYVPSVLQRHRLHDDIRNTDLND